ncbi:late control protein [Achromobacter sp. Root83]|uniref:contractile injection system protein, VgrG/Pvc8 family n=1 Tax=Achromobacter sp. Root83 TaxID=1736602 RepID=UPI0007100CC9|nr:contractile injection system protein, VgrG/Pvc8 family [Achromobacter sp. Root83]KRC85435.1 late control protein [Achromobacter sp. Root83]
MALQSTTGQAGPRAEHPAPQWRVIVDGKDMTDKVAPRLMSLSITECRSDQADQLDLVLDDADGRLALPRRGVSVRVYLGWNGPRGLVDKGTFEVDEVEFSGPPDTITLRARSADMGNALRTRATRSFHKTTIKAIVETVAKAHKLFPVVGQFGDTKIAHIDQTDESDLAFLGRIGKRYDAVATIKEGKLLFLPVGKGDTASGKEMPTIELTRRDGDRIRYHVADRDSYTGVRASWQDKGKATRRHVLAGVIGNAKRLRQLYASEEDALEAARAEWARLQRGMATLHFDLAYGRPELAPQTKVRFAGVKDPISTTVWLLSRVTHKLDDSGLTTSAEGETIDSFQQGEGADSSIDSDQSDTD